MRDRSPALDAAIRALRGEVDVELVRAAIGDWQLAHVLALAPSVHRIVRAVAALGGNVLPLLNKQDIADPAVHAAVRSLVGTQEGGCVLWSWADVAPAGWGADIADDLINAVRNGTCAPAAAAALIGPCNEAAALLTTPFDIAFAVRHWGLSVPDSPTAWMMRISSGPRQRLSHTLRLSPSDLASCSPWLPPEAIPNDAPCDADAIASALNAFAEASLVARTLHADLLTLLIAVAEPNNLDALTRLACATHSEIVQRRVRDLASEHPDFARDVVYAASWDDLAEEVQTTILDAANDSDICAAIAVARGRRKDARITQESAAAAFFAALDPDVWDKMDVAPRRPWLDKLSECDAYLAVRALGPRPEILSRALLNDDLIHAVRRHTPNDAALREALFPLALREADVDKAARVIATRPEMPNDPGAFFCIASGCRDPDVIASACSALCSPADLAVAVILQRNADGKMREKDVCAALQGALHGRSWNDLASLLASLDANARTALSPNRDALADALAHPGRRDAMRAALDAVAALPPECAIPALATLERWRTRSVDAGDTTEALTHALRDHGDLVLTIVDSLAGDDLRVALLPPLDRTELTQALRALTHADPVVGQSLAHALQQREWTATIRTMLHAPPTHAAAIWHALADDDRQAIVTTMNMAALDAPHSAASADMRACDPIAALALTALYADDPDLRACGVTALASRPALIRSLLPQLPQDIQHALRAHPAIVAALADLDDDPPSAMMTRGAPHAIRRRI